jgi:hypothetical protein
VLGNSPTTPIVAKNKINNKGLSRIELKSPLYLAHLMNSKYKYIYIQPREYFGRRVGITSIEDIFY